MKLYRVQKQVTPEELSAYYDGETVGARGRLEHVAHRLREDDAARKHYRAYAALSAGLRSLPEPAVRPNFAGDVIREIEARNEHRVASWWSGLVAPVATAAAFIVFAGVAAVSFMSTTNEPAPVQVATPSNVEAAPAELTLAQYLHDTYKEEQAAEPDVDVAWLFGSAKAAETEEPESASVDEVIMALARVEYFDRPAVAPLRTGSDVGRALTTMDDASARTFLLLLNDYAYSGESL